MVSARSGGKGGGRLTERGSGGNYDLNTKDPPARQQKEKIVMEGRGEGRRRRDRRRKRGREAAILLKSCTYIFPSKRNL